MALKLSIFTTITNPRNRQDNYLDALACYEDLADEVVVVDGATFPGTFLNHFKKVKHVNSYWPKEFKWEKIGQQFQRGYEESTGDWVIHADIDFIFHENDFERIREACMENMNYPAFTMLKRQFVLPDRFNLKSRLVVAVNKKVFGKRIRFDSGGDLCQPSLDGQYIEPGKVPDVKIPIWNYEKLLKTKQQIADDQGRMERAWERQFGKFQMGSDGTNVGAYTKWVEAQVGKFNKPQEEIDFDSHPQYVKNTIRDLKPEMWGHSGHGYLKENNYVSSR